MGGGSLTIIILFSQGQVFLTFRSENITDGVLHDCSGECCKAILCCCFTRSISEENCVKKIGSHPSFGDVITSRMITGEFCCGNCSCRVLNYLSPAQLKVSIAQIKFYPAQLRKIYNSWFSSWNRRILLWWAVPWCFSNTEPRMVHESRMFSSRREL